MNFQILLLSDASGNNVLITSGSPNDASDLLFHLSTRKKQMISTGTSAKA
jgi:hypothetical protein